MEPGFWTPISISYWVWAASWGEQVLKHFGPTWFKRRGQSWAACRQHSQQLRDGALPPQGDLHRAPTPAMAPGMGKVSTQSKQPLRKKGRTLRSRYGSRGCFQRKVNEIEGHRCQSVQHICLNHFHWKCPSGQQLVWLAWPLLVCIWICDLNSKPIKENVC